MQELHFTEKISWPEGYRMAVALTFDFQGGEDVKPDKNGKINHEEWTQGEYGPQTGIWRILRILDETSVKATFLTCGGIAERYPEAVKAIAQRVTRLQAMATIMRSRAISLAKKSARSCGRP